MEPGRFTGLVLTKLDVLTGLKKIKICRAYLSEGKEITEFPAGLQALQNCEPIYEEMEGWDEDLTGIRKFSDLPSNAQKYIKRLEELIGVKFILISVGFEREETILLKSPFDSNN